MNWEIPSDYEYTKTHTIKDWGWEFIRRNEKYIAEWNIRLETFNNMKISGELYKCLLGYPDHNPFLENFHPDEINESLYLKFGKWNYNLIDPDKYDTFLMYASETCFWQIKYFQDPRSNKLLPCNQRSHSECTVADVFANQKIAIIPNNDSIMAIIDLKKPIEPQIKYIKSEAKKSQIAITGTPLKTSDSQKNQLWVGYIRCLDAHNSKARKKIAISKIDLNIGCTPEIAWDETLKQAKKMVNVGWKKLMI